MRVSIFASGGKAVSSEQSGNERLDFLAVAVVPFARFDPETRDIQDDIAFV